MAVSTLKAFKYNRIQPKLPSSGLDNLTDLTIPAEQWKIA